MAAQSARSIDIEQIVKDWAWREYVMAAQSARSIDIEQRVKLASSH